jgi:ribonuclease P/MRP protein subunit POP7
VHASGRLRNGDVERGIADEVGRRESEGENVYLKATGRAIPKALELGVAFQGERGYVVRVEMGSVKAVDDVACEGEGEEEVPETRVRSVSCVTVSIGTK